MAFVTTQAANESQGARRPLVVALFVASILLSVVSWYTTYQGMALYLSGWFAMLASLGIQLALVMVAWLIGFSKSSRGLLVAVYAITALVSVGFSYVSLYTWFSAKERPATVQRQLFDTLSAATVRASESFTAATTAAQKHVLALEEMTVAEKANGYISRAQDSDPYLSDVRQAVAKEAQTYDGSYKEGAGGGLRYTAFERYTKLAKQSLDKLALAQASLTKLREQLKPTDTADTQLRAYHATMDTLPWTEAEQHLAAKLERPPAPNYADNIDTTSGGQEDLIIAVQGLVSAPTLRHLFSLSLAAFIDIIVFLLAFASGPYFFGASEQRWTAAAATMESADYQVFVRSFLRKITPSSNGMAKVDVEVLNSGERQLCLLLASKGQAVLSEDEGRSCYLLDPSIHEMLMDSLSTRGLPLRATAQSAAV